MQVPSNRLTMEGSLLWRSSLCPIPPSLVRGLRASARGRGWRRWRYIRGLRDPVGVRGLRAESRASQSQTIAMRRGILQFLPVKARTHEESIPQEVDPWGGLCRCG